MVFMNFQSLLVKYQIISKKNKSVNVTLLSGCFGFKKVLCIVCIPNTGLPPFCFLIYNKTLWTYI